jgi:hypothetical protein
MIAWLRALLFGWLTLAALAFGVERLMMYWIGPLFGAPWIPTVHLALDCLTLAAAGWVTGRSYRARAIPAALVFAATLCFWDFGRVLALNVPWMLRLAINSVHDTRYVDSLATSVETHFLLFGCLLAGAALSRPRAKPASLFKPG